MFCAIHLRAVQNEVPMSLIRNVNITFWGLMPDLSENTELTLLVNIINAHDIWQRSDIKAFGAIQFNW